MTRFLAPLFFLFMCSICQAQYTTTHYIAPAPWQYWSDANEAVISTTESQTVFVSIYRSDGTWIDTIPIDPGTYATSYRFSGNPAGMPRNEVGEVYTDRGLIIEASAPVLVNLRNIASDVFGTNNANIKGNASLVSFGNEGTGRMYRLGYYRSSYGGMATGNPIYTVMAMEDNTEVLLDGAPLETLQAGESTVFNAPIGALLEANNPITANVGSYGDTPTGCGGNGEDGTFTQLPPVEVLSDQYVVVRGDGSLDTSDNAPEQTTIVTTENNTTVEVTNYDNTGTQVGTPVVYTFTDAGEFETFLHGDATNQYSSSFIVADAPIAVYSGTAVGCETDISTVLPIGGCSGINDIRTQRFLDYNGGELPYFCFIILESDTEPVYVNGDNIETTTGNTRVPIGTTGFYLISFENTDVGVLDPITIESNAKLTTSIVQQGVGYSMAGFFSAFNEQLDPPAFDVTDCSVLLEAEEGMEPYQWYFNGAPIANADDQTYVPLESGNYSVSGTQLCGETIRSEEVYVPYVIPIELDLGGDRVFCELPFEHTLIGTPQNIKDMEGSVSFSWYHNGVLLGDTSSTLTINEAGVYTVIVSYDDVDCTETQTVTITAVDFEVALGADYEACDEEEYLLEPQLDGESQIDMEEVDFLWSTGETTETITASETDLYWVEVTYLGCTETAEVFVTLSDSPVISLGEDLQKCPDEEVTLSVTVENPTDNLLYYWYRDGQPIGGNTPEIAITEYGTYSIEVDQDGCVSEAEMQVSGYPNNQNCVITQGISPGGSAGQNDNLDLTFLADRTGIESLQVFNRNGNLVYTKSGYVAEWTGLSDAGEELPTGTYFYILNLSQEDPQYGAQHTGWIYINRAQ